MTLQEALKHSNKVRRSLWEHESFAYVSPDQDNLLGSMTHHPFLKFTDYIADDWVPFIKQEETKSDKILAAELVINLLKTLTEEINKSNNKIMEAVEAKDIVVTNSLISIQSELFEINKKLNNLTISQQPHSYNEPLYTTYDGVTVVPFVADVSWYKRGESNGKE